MKMTKTTACILRVLCIAALVAAFAVNGQSDGEGGYDSPYFQADFTQDLNSWTSALVNPALLFRVNQMHASMAFYRWGINNDQMGYQDFSLLYPYRYRHTMGLTVLHARNTMDRVRYGVGGGDDVTVTQTAYQDLWAIGNYGVKVLPWFWAGANLKLRTQAQFGQSAFSKVPGLDVGAYFNVLDHYRWGDLGISLMAQDILPTQTPWEFETDAVSVATSGDLVTLSRGRAGLRYSGLNDNLVVSGEILVDNAFMFITALNGNIKDEVKVYLGGKTPTLQDFFDIFPIAVRWGFHAKYMFIPQIWVKGGWTNNNIPYVGFNYNLVYPLPEMINYFNIDYNFGYSFIEKSVGELNDERGLVMMLRLSADFGRTREQKESKRLYDKLVVAPMDAYQEAMRLYTAGKYWEAAFAYGKLIALYPTFYLNDKAVYFMGDCYKHLYMNNTSREVFREALDEYTTSDMRAFYLYGIMSLDYREENYDEAMRNHAFIVNLYGESEIRGEAEYLAGEIEFMRGNVDAARAHFELVKTTDPSYLYALYTLAILNYDSDRQDEAVRNLRRIIDDTTSRASDAMLQNAASVKLGHMFFETKDKLRDAVEAYSRVKEDATPHGDEALLGIAWSWAKAGQPQLTQQKAERLIALHPKSPFVPEAHLLRGYSLMLQKRHTDAIPAFEKAIEACGGKFLTDDDVRVRKGQNDQAQDDFVPSAEKIRRNAMRKPTARSIEERPELQKDYEVFHKENKEFFEYKVLAKSHKNFFMQKEQIVEDATYALAKATSYVKNRKTTESFEGMKKDSEKLDDEMEKIRRELEGN